MASTPIPLKVDAATKRFIDASGYPIQEIDLLTIEYGVEILLNLNFYKVNVLNLATPLTVHPFLSTDLLAVRGDYDFNVSNELMFLTEEIIGNPPAWAAATAYVVGDRILSTAGDWYLCSIAGTSGGVEPTWDTDLGDTTVDNTVTWQRVENNDGINQPGDWENGSTADKTQGQYSVRINTNTTKFQAFLTFLNMKKPASPLALIQMFILPAGSIYYNTVLNSRFNASGTVDTEIAQPSPGNPAYLNTAQIAAKYVDRVFFNLASAINLQIASGVITRTSSVHTIEPETGTSDNLDTINGLQDGECCVLRLQDPANDTITLRHGVDNILTPDGNNLTLSGNANLLIIGNSAGDVEIVSPINPSTYTKRIVQDVADGATVLTAFEGLKLLRVDTTGGDATITLHAAAGWNGDLEILKTVAASTVNITGTVNGVVNPSFTSIRGSLRIINDGAGNFVTPDPITP